MNNEQMREFEAYLASLAVDGSESESELLLKLAEPCHERPSRRFFKQPRQS